MGSEKWTGWIDAGKVSNVRISNLNRSQTYYFAATTYDHDGKESNFFQEAVYNPSSNTGLINRISDWNKIKIYGSNKIASTGRNSFLQLRF
jgi:TATA-box binding protein (TBP) (component of TFIID and TFIIIB)